METSRLDVQNGFPLLLFHTTCGSSSNSSSNSSKPLTLPFKISFRIFHTLQLSDLLT